MPKPAPSTGQPPAAAADSQPVTSERTRTVTSASQTERATRTHLAPRYRVIVHDDPITEAGFVVRVLQEVFQKEHAEAVRVMLTAHHGGLALVCVLPLEQAEFRVERAHAVARRHGFPLTFTYEPE